jgi:hypothetical protein
MLFLALTKQLKDRGAVRMSILKNFRPADRFFPEKGFTAEGLFCCRTQGLGIRIRSV